MENLEVWVLVLAAPFAVIYVLLLSKWRFSKPVTIVIVSLFVIVVTAMDFIFIKDMSWMCTEHPFLDISCRIFNIFLETAFAIFLTKQSHAQTLFIVFSISLVVYIVDIVAISLDICTGSDVIVFIFKLGLYLLITTIVHRMRKIFWEVANYMKKRLWMICVVQAVLFICSAMVVSFPVPLNHSPANIPLAFMIGLVNVSVYGVFLYIFRLLHRQSTLENNAAAFHIYAASLEHQNEIIKKNAENAALFRHDIRHILQMISACAAGGDMDGINDLIKLLDKNVNTEFNLFVNPITGHRLLDTVLTRYIVLAQESDIDISVNIFGLESASTNPAEFAVVLANVMENAVNACRKQKAGDKRVIRIDGRKNGQQFFFKISNTFSGKVQFNSDTGLPVSSEAGHGTGVKSIEYFAKKTGAELLFRTEGNWFHVSILF